MRDRAIEIVPAEWRDFELLFRWALDEDMPYFTCRESYPPTREAYERMLRSQMQDKGTRLFKVIRIKDNLPVGKIASFNYNHRNRSCEVGFYFEKKYRGRGYGHRALKLLIDHLFGNMNLEKVYAQTGSYNRPMIAVLEKHGFVKEGILRKHHYVNGKYHDDYIYGIFKQEWHEAHRHEN